MLCNVGIRYKEGAYGNQAKTKLQKKDSTPGTTLVIYLLSCPCMEGLFYVDHTKRRLRDGLAEHEYVIRTKT